MHERNVKQIKTIYSNQLLTFKKQLQKETEKFSNNKTGYFLNTSCQIYLNNNAH